VAPEGAYYVLADFSGLSDMPAPEYARWLTVTGGVATVPGTSFFSRADDGRPFTRFAFCKTEEMLREAVRRLAALPHD
jgi:aspartate/methionine/tyrosine aminotransferase